MKKKWFIIFLIFVTSYLIFISIMIISPRFGRSIDAIHFKLNYLRKSTMIQNGENVVILEYGNNATRESSIQIIYQKNNKNKYSVVFKEQENFYISYSGKEELIRNSKGKVYKNNTAGLAHLLEDYSIFVFQIITNIIHQDIYNNFYAHAVVILFLLTVGYVLVLSPYEVIRHRYMFLFKDFQPSDTHIAIIVLIGALFIIFGLLYSIRISI